MSVNAEVLQSRYNLTCRQHEQGILLTAVPKDEPETWRVHGIALILDRDSFGVLAHQLVDSWGKETVHIFEDTVLNVTPSDRNQLLAPNLQGLTEIFSTTLFTGAPESQ